jgi:hypothetical protein
VQESEGARMRGEITDIKKGKSDDVLTHFYRVYARERFGD